MSETTPSAGQVAVYRFYDARERLLYVGISNDPRRRWAEHALTKPWYPQVRHQAVTWYGSEKKARAVEARAIRRDRPAFNVAGALRPPHTRLTIQAVPTVNAGVAWVLISQVIGITGCIVPGLHVLVIPAAVSMFAATLATFLVLGAPQISRAGSWLERTFTRPDPKDTR